MDDGSSSSDDDWSNGGGGGAGKRRQRRDRDFSAAAVAEEESWADRRARQRFLCKARQNVWTPHKGSAAFGSHGEGAERGGPQRQLPHAKVAAVEYEALLAEEARRLEVTDNLNEEAGPWLPQLFAVANPATFGPIARARRAGARAPA